MNQSTTSRTRIALMRAFLSGETVNCRNIHKMVGFTYCSREVIRVIEEPFGVRLKRVPRKGKSRYGETCHWYDYKLSKNSLNRKGISLMKKAIKEFLLTQPS